MTIQRSLINETYKSAIYECIASVGLATAAVLTPCEAIRIIGMTVLTSAAYGIMNDMFACRDCIEYFTVGHVYEGKKFDKRILNTLNPDLNALVWGILATYQQSAPFGVLLSIAARAPFHGAPPKVTASQIFPYLAIGAIGTLVISHIRAQLAKKMVDIPEYQNSVIPNEKQSSWHACQVRNSTGAHLLLGGGILLAIGIFLSRE